jgi:hypothetical protein
MRAIGYVTSGRVKYKIVFFCLSKILSIISVSEERMNGMVRGVLDCDGLHRRGSTIMVGPV